MLRIEVNVDKNLKVHKGNLVVGAGTSTVTILKSTLLKGHYYKLIADGSTYKSAVGSATYVFFTNCPPHTGTCAVTPTSGKSNRL